jgi:ABC-type glutathione transport system ATPase component
LPEFPHGGRSEYAAPKETKSLLLEVEDLYVRYRGRSGHFIDAISGVSLSLNAGQHTALAGATGCGKSTIAKAITGLVPVRSGEIRFEGEILDFSRVPALRRHVQMIFQDPYSALYPHKTLGDFLREAIRYHHLAPRKEEDDVVCNILQRVGLPSSFRYRYARQLSGGERQRVQIARALLLKPRLLICDEITSGLDTELQIQILQLLKEISEESGMTLLVISHDLHVVRHLATSIIVMDAGKIVESGAVAEVFTNPSHPVTVRLIREYSHQGSDSLDAK